MAKKRVEDVRYNERESQLAFLLCNEIISKSYEYPSISNKAIEHIICEITHRKFGCPMVSHSIFFGDKNIKQTYDSLSKL